MRLILLTLVVLSACATPPDAMMYQVIFNPFCILKCAAGDVNGPVAKGNMSGQNE